DAVRVAAIAASRRVRQLAVTKLSAGRETLASDRRRGQRSVLQPGASAWPIVCFGLHAHGEFGSDDRRPGVRPLGLSLCADVLELGIDHDLFFRELREPQRRASKRGLGIGRRALGAVLETAGISGYSGPCGMFGL